MNTLYIVPGAIKDLDSWTMIFFWGGDLLEFYYLASDLKSFVLSYGVHCLQETSEKPM